MNSVMIQFNMSKSSGLNKAGQKIRTFLSLESPIELKLTLSFKLKSVITLSKSALEDGERIVTINLVGPTVAAYILPDY